MNHASLPGQISISLTWSNVTPLLQNLQNSLKGQSWLRSLLLVGENPNLCLRLQQAWYEAAQTCHYPVEAFQHALIPARNDSSNAQVAVNLPTACLPDIEAGCLILSSGLNLWLQIQTGVHPEVSADLWQVSLVFDPQAIANFLKIPAIATAVPHCSELIAIDLHNDPQILRQFWLQLLPLSQSHHPQDARTDTRTMVAAKPAVRDALLISQAPAPTSWPAPLLALPSEFSQWFSQCSPYP